MEEKDHKLKSFTLKVKSYPHHFQTTAINMGTVQSTHTTSMEIASNEAKSSVSGRKNNEDLVVEEEPTQISNADLDDDSQEAYAEYESSDDDEEEGTS